MGRFRVTRLFVSKFSDFHSSLPIPVLFVSISEYFLFHFQYIISSPLSRLFTRPDSSKFPPPQTNCDRIIDYHITTNPSLNKKSPSSTVPGSAIVVNSVDVSGIGSGGGTAEGCVFDLEIASLIHQLWQDPVTPKVMDHSSEFYLMDSAS
jgi:hypothetical protein